MKDFFDSDRYDRSSYVASGCMGADGKDPIPNCETCTNRLYVAVLGSGRWGLMAYQCPFDFLYKHRRSSCIGVNIVKDIRNG